MTVLGTSGDDCYVLNDSGIWRLRCAELLLDSSGGTDDPINKTRSWCQRKTVYYGYFCYT